jgi:hypothetical protein
MGSNPIVASTIQSRHGLPAKTIALRLNTCGRLLLPQIYTLMTDGFDEVKMVLDTFISLAEAAKRLSTPESQVRAMVDAGKIKGAVINGDVVVREKDVKIKRPKIQLVKQPKIQSHKQPKIQPIKQISNLRREDLPEYQQFSHLQGQPIWVAEAARKYNIVHQNVSRWIKAGVIKQVGVDRNRLLLDEQDVAYCAYVYHQRNAKRGSWLFRPDGTPYEYRDALKEMVA